MNHGQHLINLRHALVDLGNALFDFRAIGGQFRLRRIELFASRGELRFARFELGARFGYLLATLRDLLTGRCNLRTSIGELPFAIGNGCPVVLQFGTAILQCRFVGFQLGPVVVDLLLGFVQLLVGLVLGIIQFALRAGDDLLTTGFLACGLYLMFDTVGHGFDGFIVGIGKRVKIGRTSDGNRYRSVYIAGHAVAGCKERIVLG